MSALTILTGTDNPVLRGKNKKVITITKDIVRLIKDMEATTAVADGMGLAAPQVGQSIQLCLVRIGDRLQPMFNPEIVQKSTDMEVAEEGCLSLPNVWLQIPRPVSIVVKYMDMKGNEQERMLQGLEARIVQHEIDHLNGVLIIDYHQDGVVL